MNRLFYFAANMHETGLTKKQVLGSIAALLVLYFISVMVNLGLPELDGEEPRRAIISLEMIESGQYLNPTQFGWPYYNKPVVFNWILIVFIKIFGSAAEWVLRLPSLLCYLVWAATHYFFSKKYISKAGALLSAFFLLTAADIYFYGLANGAEIDVFYSFVVYLQAISIFHFYNKGQWARLYLVSYFLCALGFLTKGFPSLVFEIFTLAAICLYARSWRPLFRWQHFAGIFLFIVITGIYFWVYSLQGNALHLLMNFLNESLAKSAIGERSNKIFEKAIGYPLLLLKLAAPWSLLLLLLFSKAVRMQIKQNPLAFFSILFIACNIWIYWLTGQPKARYIYMFVPFGTILFVQLLQAGLQVQRENVERALKWFALIFLMVAIGLVVLAFFTTASLRVAIALAALLLLFTWQYLRLKPALRIWALVAGTVLLRFIYAVLIIPVQLDLTGYYRLHAMELVKTSGKGPLIYYAPVQPLIISDGVRFFPFSKDTIWVPKPLPSQVPYYYYRFSGHLMRFDTTLHKGINTVSYTTDLDHGSRDTLKLMPQKRERNTFIFYRPG